MRAALLVGALPCGGTAVHFTVPDIVLQPHQTTDLGHIMVPASGVLAAELTAEAGLRTDDLRMELEGPTSHLVAIAAATLRGEQRVLPGRYQVTVYGTGCRWLYQSIDVLPGATATVRGTLRAAVRVGLRLHMPPGERGATFVVRDGRGEQVFATELAAGTAHEDQWPFLDRGTFHVEAIGASGRRHAARFTVESLERASEPIDVRVEPVR